MSDNLIVVANNTTPPDNTLRVALYHTPEIAWRIISPDAEGGDATVLVPETLQVAAVYTENDVRYTTNMIELSSESALLRVAATQSGEDGQTTISLGLVSQGGSAPTQGEIMVEVPANVGRGVDIELMKACSPIVPLANVAPGQTVSFAFQPKYYAAKVSSNAVPGESLANEDLNATQVEVKPGEVASVTGNQEGGFTIKVSEYVPEPVVQ